MKNHTISERNLSQTIMFGDLETHTQTNIESNESYLLYYTFTEKLDVKVWNHYLNILPKRFHNEVYKYRRWQDRYNFLIGRLLVYLGHYLFCGSPLEFNRFLKDPYGKPFLKDSSMHFNISHSGNKVVCIFSKQAIGIDIEEIQDIEFSLFENVFLDREMEQIRDLGIAKFYEYWTKKEAIIKAIGKGMSISLLDINVENESTVYNNDKWNTTSYVMDNVHCSIASQYPENKIRQIQIQF
ncbi:4'-phosphopantetheinyl transferase family protein [Aquimarina sp. M1]